MDAKLARLIGKLQSSFPHQRDVEGAMRDQLTRIRMRTAMGRGVDGFPFLRKRDGSPSYLHKTGNLLRSLQAGAGVGGRGLEGRITVTGRAREYAPLVNAKRRFMGMTEGDKHQILSDVRESMRDRRNQA